MRPKLEDIRFVNQCARDQFKRELGRRLARPEPKPATGSAKTTSNPLWGIRLKETCNLVTRTDGKGEHQ